MKKTIDLSQIQTGDVINCRPRKTFLSKAISIITKGSFSHTGTFLVLGGIVFVVDAQKDGFNPRLFEEWTDEYGYEYVVYRAPNSNPSEKQDKILALCGTDYDLEGLLIRQPRKYWIRFTNRFRKLFRKPLKAEWIHKGEAEGFKMTCSEAIMRIEGAEGWESMSPQEAFEYQMSHGYGFIGSNV